MLESESSHADTFSNRQCRMHAFTHDASLAEAHVADQEHVASGKKLKVRSQR